MKVCFELSADLSFAIKLEQHEDKRGHFRVTYGLQVKDNLTYAQASKEFGECVFHALACEGQLNNEGL